MVFYNILQGCPLLNMVGCIGLGDIFPFMDDQMEKKLENNGNWDHRFFML